MFFFYPMYIMTIIIHHCLSQFHIISTVIIKPTVCIWFIVILEFKLANTLCIYHQID